MFGTRFHHLAAWVVVATAGTWTTSAQAQFFNRCDPCAAAPVAQIAPPVAFNSCQCVQPVTQTVYRDVPVTEYRTVQKTVKQPKIVTVMEEQDVTVYKTVTEAKTVSVPSVDYQTVSENVPVTVNNSYWRTVYQCVPKVSPCQYDSRPTLLGEMNRMGYSMRSAFTPNQIARREFVPNVSQYAVAQQRTVAVPTTRQVTYNVARVVPVQERQQVAVQKTIWEDATVTAYEPFTTTRRVAVGATTQYAYVNPFGGTTATAAAPTPAGTSQTAEAPASSNSATKQSARDMGTINLNSAPKSSVPVQQPTYQAQPEPVSSEPSGPVAAAKPASMETAGWRAHQPAGSGKPAVDGSGLSVVSK